MTGQSQPGAHPFEVWRCDDNGNQFRVDAHPDRESAERRIRALRAGGHKQTYWVREAAAAGEIDEGA